VSDRLLWPIRVSTFAAGLVVRWAPLAAITRLADVLLLAGSAKDPDHILIQCLAEACLVEMRRRGKAWTAPHP
jgi:hypothetical protein